MTDRWRAALRDLDDLGPDESVYRRARQGPSRPDPPVGPSRGKRLVAGVTAVAIFALAAGFAWRALRPSGESVALAPGSVPGLSSYTDPAGWSVSYPSAWSLSPIDIRDRITTQGVVIANGPGGLASPNAATPGPIGPDLGSAPSDLVALGITATSGGPPGGTPVDDDTPLPLSASDLKVLPGTCTVCPAYMDIQTNGVRYEIALWSGRDASEADIAAARAIIESFTGASLRSGTVTAGWTPVVAPQGGFPTEEATAAVLSGAPELQRLGVIYVMHPASGPIYALDLVPDTCGEGQDQRWDPQAQEIRVTCPDGTVIRFDPEGRPLPGNPADADRPLQAYPVIRSWDGQFLLGVWEPYPEQPKWTP